jgi:hypothetical protein
LQQDSQFGWMLAGRREVTNSICFRKGGGAISSSANLQGQKCINNVTRVIFVRRGSIFDVDQHTMLDKAVEQKSELKHWYRTEGDRTDLH